MRKDKLLQHYFSSDNWIFLISDYLRSILAVPCTFQTGSYPSANALAAPSVWNASPLDFLMAYSLTPLRSFFECQRLAEACLSHLFTVASHPCNWYAPPSVPTLVFYKAHICLIRE